MKILFLSLLFEREKEDFYKKKVRGMIQNASNTFQYAVLDGFYENQTLADIFLINSLPVGTFGSGYDELFLKESPFVYEGKDIGVTISCINLPVLKQFTRYKNVCKQLTKYIEQNRNEDIKIITYNVYEPYIHACSKIKKKYKNIEICPIITDLPGQFGILPKAWWKRIYVLHAAKKIFKYLKSADRYVFLTELMKVPLAVDKDYIVMEGIYSNIDGVNNSVVAAEPSNKKIILYTGVLNREYGILTLLDAFDKIPQKDIELWICGGIGEVEEVKRRAERDQRIKFYGNVPRKQAIEYQRKASLLINPRPNRGEFVKYSFPSKTMEYLSSGRPVLMYKLAGIPHEYDIYLNYIPEYTPESMKDSILNILYGDYDMYLTKAAWGREFVLKTKNSKAQAKRILDFLAATE